MFCWSNTAASDRSVFVRMPSALGIPMNTRKYNWGFESAPEPYLDNRRMNCPRGKVIGGIFLYKWHGLCKRACLRFWTNGNLLVRLDGTIRAAYRILIS